MRFNFDLLLEKNYPGGGKKVVSFCRLAQDPTILGSLEGVVGRLTTVKGGIYDGYSLMSLANNYQISLPAIRTEKGFVYPNSLRFNFTDANDVMSLEAVLIGDGDVRLALPKQVEAEKISFTIERSDTVLVIGIGEGDVYLEKE